MALICKLRTAIKIRVCRYFGFWTTAFVLSIYLEVDFCLARSFYGNRQVASTSFTRVDVEFIIAIDVSTLDSLSENSDLIRSPICDWSDRKLEGTSCWFTNTKSWLFLREKISSEVAQQNMQTRLDGHSDILDKIRKNYRPI